MGRKDKHLGTILNTYGYDCSFGKAESTPLCALKRTLLNVFESRLYCLLYCDYIFKFPDMNTFWRKFYIIEAKIILDPSFRVIGSRMYVHGV